MPTQLRTPAVSIDKQGPSQLQQLAGPMYVKVMVYAQHYSSQATNRIQTMYHGTCLLGSNAR